MRRPNSPRIKTGINRFERPGRTWARRKNLFSRLGLGLALLVTSGGIVSAQTTKQRSFPIRGGSQPVPITIGADCNLWFTLSNSNQVARITPRGVIGYFVTPTLSNPVFITPGSDGNIWFEVGHLFRRQTTAPANGRLFAIYGQHRVSGLPKFASGGRNSDPDSLNAQKHRTQRTQQL